MEFRASLVLTDMETEHLSWKLKQWLLVSNLPITRLGRQISEENFHNFHQQSERHKSFYFLHLNLIPFEVICSCN